MTLGNKSILKAGDESKNGTSVLGSTSELSEFEFNLKTDSQKSQKIFLVRQFLCPKNCPRSFFCKTKFAKACAQSYFKIVAALIC